jgi:5-(carboxyamino)imidazole ribonucleotide synthase
VRTHQGECFFYPLTLNLHLNGILMASIAPLPHLDQEKTSALQQQAEHMLTAILNDLDYIGVMAMECFRIKDQLLINELAPRVHNSGHWTQAGASYSQFEAHLRALAQLPLGTPVIRAPSAMVNLIGVEKNNDWLKARGAQLFWYGKEVRPGRKVGHINFCDPDKPQLLDALSDLLHKLPDPYSSVLQWVEQQLCS